jgi:hypothetical protein
MVMHMLIYWYSRSSSTRRCGDEHVAKVRRRSACDLRSGLGPVAKDATQYGDGTAASGHEPRRGCRRYPAESDNVDVGPRSLRSEHGLFANRRPNVARLGRGARHWRKERPLHAAFGREAHLRLAMR